MNNNNNWAQIGGGPELNAAAPQDYDLKVILKIGSGTQRIAGAPLKYLNDSPS